LSLLKRIFGERKERAALDPLYRAIVSAGRDPFWYVEGQVPDTLDGRFDMVTTITALTLLRLEADGDAGQQPTVLLTEIFVDDMDGTLRQIGIGDYVVSKHVGRMMGALGGRLGAFRAADEAGTGYAEAVRRNIFHEAPPSDAAVAAVSARLERFAAALRETGMDDLRAGRLPAL
jgi:cytochrome b pre-mRNA-processing protein 3